MRSGKKMKKGLKMQNNTFNKQKYSNADIFVYGILIMLAIVFQIIVFYNYFVIGVHNWHIQQPEVIQGGTELLIFLALTAIGVYFTKKSLYAKLLIILLASIYLELHHVLISTLTVLLYFELIILVGNNVLNILKLKNKQSFNNYVSSFLIGICTYCLIFLTMSILGYGTIFYSRILVGFFIIFCLLYGLKVGFKKPFTAFIFDKFSSQNFIQKFICLMLFFLFLTAAAKGIYIDYDSIWYNLRSEYVLIGQNSFFDNLGLHEWVNFYPKLVEIFQLPLSELSSYTFITNANAVILIFIIGIIIKFFRKLNVEHTLALLFTLSISTLPFIVGFAALAKHDIFTTFLMLAAVYFSYLFIDTLEVDKLIISIISIFLSFGGKLTSALFMPPLVLALIIVFVYWLKYNKKRYNLFLEHLKILDKKNYILLLSGFLVLLITCARTFLLTGYPFFPFMQNVFNKLGFEGKYPFIGTYDVPLGASSNIQITSLKNLLVNCYNILFNPNYAHLIFSWFSNVYFYLSLFIIVMVIFNFLNKKIKDKLAFNDKFLFLFLLFTFYTIISFIFTVFAPDRNKIDGYYYMLSFVFIMIFLLHIINFLIKRDLIIKKAFILCLIIFIPLNTLIMFTTSFTWHQGTAAFSLNLLDPIYNKYDLKNAEFEYSGLQEIQDYILRNNKSNEKKGCYIGYGDARVIYKLDCRIGGISYLPKFITQNSQSLSNYIKTVDIDYLIFSNETLSEEFYSEIYKKYAENSSNTMIKSGNYTFIDRSSEK